MLPADLLGLYESYKNVYNETEDYISDELIEEIVEELVNECIDFGYSLDESTYAVKDAIDEYFDSLDELEEAKITYGSDTESPEQRAARAKARHGTVKSAARKAAVKGAVERVQQKASGAKAAAGIAGSIAKDEVRRAGRAVAHGATKAAGAVSSAISRKKEEVKSGVKKLLGKGLRAAAGGAGKVAQMARKAGSAAGRAAERLGEEVIDEAAVRNRGLIDGREQLANKAIDSSGRKVPTHPKGLRMIPTHHSASRLPSGDLKTKAKNKAKKDAYYQNQRYGKGSMRIEEFEGDIFDYILEHLVAEGYADTNEAALVIMANMSEGWREEILEDSAAYAARIAANNKKYDAARKKAAQRASARNAARDAGQTGSVPGVGYVTPRRERTTYTDAAGTERHHSGAKAK
jgi:hypothetical protein